MNWRLGFAVLNTALLAAPAFPQAVQSWRATMNGRGGDHGKCTIEVEVDGAADVELFGDSGRIRTLWGSPANWRRFECNSPIPRNPADFRFSGIDGRGRQSLVADPRSNRGVAVIRIEDPKGGREGYTFDVEWRNGYGGGYTGGGGYPGRGRWDDDGGSYYPGDPGRDPDGVVDACQDAVRDRAVRDFGLRNLRFYAPDRVFDQRPRTVISGGFDAWLGGGRGSAPYRYTCTVNGGGRVKSVDVRPAYRDGDRDGDWDRD